MTEDLSVSPNRDPQRACGREQLVAAIAAFLTHKQVPGIREILAPFERVIDEAGREAIDSLSRRLPLVGAEWGYFPRDPLVRRMHHVFASHVLQHDLAVLGTEHLEAVAGKSVVVFANHLSYADAHVLDFLLHQFGGSEMSDRLTVVAGPKVYSHLQRRFSSLCFGTIKTPQNSGRATEEAVMSPREVGRAARCSLQVARERLQLGEALLIFPEGTRSRSGQMQQLLSGAARYLQSPSTWVLPIGMTGPERLFPIGEDALHPAPITLQIGRAAVASVLVESAHRDRRIIMDCVGYAIAELLPRAYRGYYAGEVQPDEQVRSLSRKVFQ